MSRVSRMPFCKSAAHRHTADWIIFPLPLLVPYKRYLGLSNNYYFPVSAAGWKAEISCAVPLPPKNLPSDCRCVCSNKARKAHARINGALDCMHSNAEMHFPAAPVSSHLTSQEKYFLPVAKPAFSR